MDDVRKEMNVVDRIVEDFDVEPSTEQKQTFLALLEKYRANAESSEPWSKEHGWTDIRLGEFVHLVYDVTKGYQMKTTMNSNVYGFADVKQWAEETDYAELLLIKFKEIRIPVCP